MPQQAIGWSFVRCEYGWTFLSGNPATVQNASIRHRTSRRFCGWRLKLPSVGGRNAKRHSECDGYFALHKRSHPVPETE